MRIEHRGVTVEIPDADLRVGIIERLVFTPVPEPAPAPAPEPAAPARPDVPEAWDRFWRGLDPAGRRELALLAEKPRRVGEIERALSGLGRGSLRSRHLVLSHRARAAGVVLTLRASGRGRAHRRFLISDEDARWVRALARITPESWR